MNALQAYSAPAGARRGWWRPIVGVLLVVLCWILGTTAVFTAYTLVSFMGSGDLNAALAELQSFMTGGRPDKIAIMLLTFGGIWIGIWIALKLIHAQPFMTIFAPDRRIHLRGFLRGLLLALFFAGPSAVVGLALAEPIRSDLAIGDWALWLAPLVVLIFIQATGEELIFRGYLLQQLAVRSRHAIIWAGIPSVLFGMMHYHAGLPDNGGIYYVVITFLMGVTLSVLVWRSGSLWPAAGLHLGVNVLSLTVIGADGVLSGTQLWLFDEADLIPLMQVDLVVSVILLAFVISPLGRIFGDGQIRRPDPGAEVYG